MEISIITKADVDSIMSLLMKIDQKIEVSVNGKDLSRKPGYSVKETCELLSVSSRTLQRYRDLGMIGFTQVGSKILFTAEQIQSFIATNSIEPFNPNKHGK